MHILILPSWFEDSKHPTLGSFFKDQAKALNSIGEKVGIIHPHAVSFKGLHLWRPEKLYYDNKIPILIKSYLTIPKQRQLNINRRIKQFDFLFSTYSKQFGKPDLLHAHSCALGPFGSGGIAAHYISQKHNIPYVITEHASAFHTGNFHKKDVKLVQDAFMHANQVIAVSNNLAKDLCEFGIKKNIEIIGNIIDIESFNIIPEIKDKQHYTFITIAYLRPIKNIHLIIKAFAKALKINKNLRLKIIGDGEQKSELISLANKLHLNNTVEFLGELPRPQVAQEIAKSNCYILASEYETFSVAAHEALAAGKPVISTSCGGVEDILKKLNETIVSSSEPDILMQAMVNQCNITQSYSDIALKKKYIKEQFSEESIARKLIDIYIKVI